jgi:MFS family permease
VTFLAGLVLNAYTIVFAAVLVPVGRWADRAGRRRVLIAGLAVFVLGSVLCGIAPGSPR